MTSQRVSLLTIIKTMTALLIACSAVVSNPIQGFTQNETAAASPEWPMAGANPQRTSWTAEQVPSASYLASHRNDWNNGMLYPQWAKPIEPYIPHKVQVIAANDTLYISTASGLYALDAATGAEKWVYATEMPLGHSPTVYNGRVYVGGLDHKIHALDALTGQKLWTFEAGVDGLPSPELSAGFETNPLVVEVAGQTCIYSGNRDGIMYAIRDDGIRATLMWRFQTQGPILFSAAYYNGSIYFASNDSYAYALNAQTGELVWRSEKLPGSGFNSWWPVVYTEPVSQKTYVAFAGSHNYRDGVPPGPNGSWVNLEHLDREAFPSSAARGTPVGQRNKDGWIDTSKPTGGTGVSTYFENKPWRRTTFILDAGTGKEMTYDSDGDGKQEYAPFLWFGSQSGVRYPPVMGADGLYYQANGFWYADYINGGGISGWRLGTPYLSTPSSYWHAVDEPIAYSIGGNIVYWTMHQDLSAGSFDLSVPNTQPLDSSVEAAPDPTREWVYWNYNLDSLLPGYDTAHSGWNFGGENGSYGRNGDQNAPIPYKGKVYVIRGNAVIALGPQQVQATTLPTAPTQAVQGTTHPVVTREQLVQRLTSEVRKIVQAGHLRPGYFSSGHIDGPAESECGDDFSDYFHHPADTIYTLTWAWPYLPDDLQKQVQSYLQTELATYPLASVSHVGWQSGQSREAFDLPPDVASDLPNYPPTTWNSTFVGWGGSSDGPRWPPYLFYALWKYAELFGGAKSLFDANRDVLMPVPSDSILTRYPFVVNAYISGYQGYLELQRLAGYPESATVQAELDRLRSFRVSHFTPQSPYADAGDNAYCQAFNASGNFIFLTPELGQYLHDHALSQVRDALDEYNRTVPYWFVSAYEDTINEAVHEPLYDVLLFQARALILQEPQEELVKYLDVPTFQRGDLFYIQNLVAAIETVPPVEKTVSSSSGRQGDTLTYTLTFHGTGDTQTLTDSLPQGVSAPADLQLEGTSVTPAYDSSQHRLTWTGAPAAGQQVIIRYTVVITTTHHQILVNNVALSTADGPASTDSTMVLANPFRAFLPLLFKRSSALLRERPHPMM